MSGLRIKKGDRVRVLQGKDRGKEGSVTRVLPRDDRVIVEGVNIAKKHQKPTRRTMQGGIIDKDMPMPASNVAVLCPKGHPTRVGYEFNDDGTKRRVCKKCGADLG
jgi:large subunit ribosomal protein L24